MIPIIFGTTAKLIYLYEDHPIPFEAYLRKFSYLALELIIFFGVLILIRILWKLCFLLWEGHD